MVFFKELRVTPDGRTLIIDAAIDNKTFYKHVFIDSIIIDTQGTYVNSGPSARPIYTYTLPTSMEQKEFRLELDITELGVNVNTTMFFVYVKTRGEVAPDVPCGTVKDLIMGTVVNLRPIYRKALQFMKEVGKNCEIPKGFIDLIIKVKALELSIRTGNYVQAIKYWNKFFLTSIYNNKELDCSCGYLK